MNLHELQVVCGVEDVMVVVAEAMQGRPATRANAARCPFDGLVEVRFHLGQWDWECPKCGSTHEGDDDAEGRPDREVTGWQARSRATRSAERAI